MDQRRFVEAQPLIRNLRYEAFQLVQPHDHLAINVAEAEAWLAEVLGNNDTSESLRRQILQITLASYGPKHWRAIFAMSDLGCAIPLWSTESGEILLRTAVQLSVEGSGRSADSTNSTANRCRITANLVRIMANLVKMLKHKGAHEESHNIATKTIDAFAPVLGATNQELLEVKYLLAWNVYKLGRLQESEEQFRALASLYPAYDFFKSDETVFPRNTLLNVWSGLADVLWDMGKGNEAASWLEKSFRGALSIGRANSRTTEDTCRRLGSCYEINGRYNDALKLYNQMIDEIRKLGNDHAGAIPQYESEISRIQDCMRGSTSSSIEETDDSDQSEWKSSNFQEEAELEVGAGCDEDNDAQMTVEDLSEKEGWKEFINED
jgi:tetratricopeptide (TPR) repeat protein